jgi:hypothetical protein
MTHLIASIRTLNSIQLPKHLLAMLVLLCSYPAFVDVSSFKNFYENSLTAESLGPSIVVTQFNDYERELVDESFSIEHEYYDISNIPRAFRHKTPLHYLTQFDKKDVIENVLSILPKKLKKRAYKYIPYFFYYSQKYSIDPYWAISIAWTESHFNTRARSWVGARGIMQIMPQTEKWLKHQLSNKNQYGNRTVQNIELGIFYLSKLLKQFRGNFREATVAYNMGPGWVKRWKARRRYVGSKRNVYFRKVKSFYNVLSRSHYNFVKGCDHEYLTTLVVRPSKRVQRRYILNQDRLFRVAMAPKISMN